MKMKTQYAKNWFEFAAYANSYTVFPLQIKTKLWVRGKANSSESV